MRPVSGAFLTALRGSHKVFTRARVLTAYQEGVAPTGVEVPVVDGAVRAAARSDVRCSLDLTTLGRRRWPDAPTDLLTPYGNELFVERGVDYGTGTVEVVSLGYYRIDAVDQESGPDGEIKLSGSDRMIGLIDGRLVEPVEFATGASVADVFDLLVHEIYPTATIEFDFDANSATFDAHHIAEEDRYRFLYDVVTSRGKIMYWDHRGTLQVRDPPSGSDPVFDVNAGRDGVLVQLSRELSREGVYNAVVAHGEAAVDTGTDVQPVSAVVYDNDVASPTYWFGRFGKVPRFYASSFIESVDGAVSAARAILERATGLPYNISLTSVPNPALEVYDPITVSYRDGSSVHVIDSVDTPLTATRAQTIATRTRIDLDAGEEIL